jgi:cysteinyl-tRNA synthetase
MIRFYNFLTRRKEDFKPIRKEWVGLYTCGPTVYNFAHIGNLRTYIFEDVLGRTLTYGGYRVRHVMNITDVEDKIIRAAARAQKTIFKFTKPFEKAFREDIGKLNIQKAWKYPRATTHIPAMIRLVASLLKRGYAYEADGSIYFDISKFRPYGKLARIRRRGQGKGIRVDDDEYGKNQAEDFVLWKKEKPGEPSWDAPFGKGRPGWHLECSAMSMKYLGETFDIHAGGIDLLFPHHENEIAQSEGATGKPFVCVFMEGEHLMVSGEKMAKSLGNVFTLRDIEAQGIRPLAFRYLVLGAHYRSKLNFTWESLEAAQKSLERLYDALRRLKYAALRNPKNAPGGGARKMSRANLDAVREKFKRALFNDLDTPGILAVLWDAIRAYHKDPEKYDAREVLRLFYEFDHVLGFGLPKAAGEKIPQKILALVEEREERRKEGKWKEADQMREKITGSGWHIEDTPDGPVVHRNVVTDGR